MKGRTRRVASALPFIVGASLALLGCNETKTGSHARDYRTATEAALAQLGVPASDVSSIALVPDRGSEGIITSYHVWARRISCQGWVVFLYVGEDLIDPYATGRCNLP